GPDHVSWQVLKSIASARMVEGVKRIGNACIEVGYWPTLFKESTTVVIPKPNKDDYQKANAHRPITLLNCVGKWIEKAIAKRMQFECFKYDLLHPCQFGGVMSRSAEVVGAMLVQNIKAGWKSGRVTSGCA